jgi:signal transduction histidine kinase
MNEVYKSIERLDATIHDIIEYSKNARLDIEPIEVDIDRIIHDTQEDLKFYEDTRVDIQISITKEATLFSDARRIKSIVHNIMSNAVKYADASKEICWASVHVNLTSSQCSLVFTDNGIGIAEDNIDRVFDMFYRATSQRTGSGLGLYIVKEMVQKLGGTMAIQSSIGQGTTIRIDLPNRI